MYIKMPTEMSIYCIHVYTCTLSCARAIYTYMYMYMYIIILHMLSLLYTDVHTRTHTCMLVISCCIYTCSCQVGMIPRHFRGEIGKPSNEASCSVYISCYNMGIEHADHNKLLMSSAIHNQMDFHHSEEAERE